MELFNNKTRTENALKISLIGGLFSFLKILFGFFYRIIFLKYLSVSYLGINGLFSNVLQVLSMTELGITTAITYRFYKPIKEKDTIKVGKLINFYKYVYRYIALATLLIGVGILPFVGFFIKDVSEIPYDINIYVIYFLFLMDSVVSYLFSYRITLLTVDQKNYVVSFISFISCVLSYLGRIVIIAFTRNYTIAIGFNIIVTLLVNTIGSIYVGRKYKEVFNVKEKLEKVERKQIYKDTVASMCHKVGTVVLNGTDNIVLTRTVSLIATGLYSNYSLIIISIQSIINQMIGNFTAGVGNALNSMTKKEYYALYKKMNFASFWIAVIVSSSLYSVIDEFICIWLGNEFVFNKKTTLVLCLQLYLGLTRGINGAFINAEGLFVKDKFRALIEAALNLTISILLANKYGIIGVFLGTIISSMLTVGWREPYILYKYAFNKKVFEYWKVFFEFMFVEIMAIIFVSIMDWKMDSIKTTLFLLLFKGAITFLVINFVLAVLWRKSDEYNYYKKMILKVINGKKRG